jgi:hypothetical protein
MTQDDVQFGARLCEELKKFGRFDLITRRFDYGAIQRLKAADRDATVKLFQGSPYELLQMLKALAPNEAAQRLIQLHNAAATNAAITGMMGAL